jgi:hypothetical protein
VLHLQLIIFLVGDDISVNSETLLVTDFVNLKIKPAQLFRDAHIGYRVFIGMSAHIYMSICVCIMFLKKSKIGNQPSHLNPCILLLLPFAFPVWLPNTT